jgi:hypothetical protein
MELLERTYEDRSQAVIPTSDSTDAEVKEVIALLKRGAKNLDKRFRYQSDGISLRFYVEDK